MNAHQFYESLCISDCYINIMVPTSNTAQDTWMTLSEAESLERSKSDYCCRRGSESLTASSYEFEENFKQESMMVGSVVVVSDQPQP
ncbi:hypothetical protein TNCV_650611 [Trichonephila clavipes]|nr:hypothetical protein TNCV_650611 [Trichonephila clavipes]